MLLYYITDRHAFPGTEAEKRVRLLAKIAEVARCGVDFVQLREKDLSPRELERFAREAVQVVRDHTPLDSPETATRILINSRTDIALAVGADGVHLTSNDVAANEARAIWATSKRLTSAAEAAASDGVDDTAEAVPFPRSSNSDFVVAVSCHTADEVRLAEAHGADFAVFAPVFEKKVRNAERRQDVPATAAGTAALQRQQSARAGQERDITLFSRSNDDGLAALKQACQGLAFPNNVEGVGTSSMPVLALGGITLENARDCVKAGAAGIAGIRLFQDNDVAEIVSRLRGQAFSQRT